jgi:hypothetical protein
VTYLSVNKDAKQILSLSCGDRPFPVRFGGRVTQFTDEHGDSRFHWVDGEEVMAMAFDTPVPGYGTNTVNNMRLCPGQ